MVVPILFLLDNDRAFKPTNGFNANPITCNTAELTTDVTASATGGSGTLTYEITAPAARISNATGIFTGLAPNTYTIKVTDANGCSFTNIYRVMQ
jgi:hypothetical protein